MSVLYRPSCTGRLLWRLLFTILDLNRVGCPGKGSRLLVVLLSLEVSSGVVMVTLGDGGSRIGLGGLGLLRRKILFVEFLGPEFTSITLNDLPSYY